MHHFAIDGAINVSNVGGSAQRQHDCELPTLFGRIRHVPASGTECRCSGALPEQHLNEAALQTSLRGQAASLQVQRASNQNFCRCPG